MPLTSSHINFHDNQNLCSDVVLDNDAHLVRCMDCGFLLWLPFYITSHSHGHHPPVAVGGIGVVPVCADGELRAPLGLSGRGVQCSRSPRAGARVPPWQDGGPDLELLKSPKARQWLPWEQGSVPIPQSILPKCARHECQKKGNLSCGREDQTEVYLAHSSLTEESEWKYLIAELMK